MYLVNVTRYFTSRVFMTFSLWASSPASQCPSHCGQMRLRVLIFVLHCTRVAIPTLLNCAFYLLLCTVFLLNADPSLLTWLCTSLSFSLSQARLLSARDSATSYLATARRSARSLHHCIRRLSCGLLEVGLRYVLDLAASHRLDHLCLPLHLWSHCSFLRDHDLSLKLFHITSTRSFHGVRISPWTFSLCRTRDANFGLCSYFNHTLFVQMSVSVCIQRLYHNFAGDRDDPNSLFHDLAVRWRNGNHRSNSLFHDLVVCFDRIVARLFIMTIILVRGLHIAHVHELF